MLQSTGMSSLGSNGLNFLLFSVSILCFCRVHCTKKNVMIFIYVRAATSVRHIKVPPITELLRLGMFHVVPSKGCAVFILKRFRSCLYLWKISYCWSDRRGTFSTCISNATGFMTTIPFMFVKEDSRTWHWNFNSQQNSKS